MSSITFAAVLLSLVAFCSSQVYPRDSQYVSARFYSNFVHLNRLPTAKLSKFNRTVEFYPFYFSETQYSRISEESLTMMHTDVLERTIVHHSRPNFEEVGSVYLYREDYRQKRWIEIELVNPNDLLFREVHNPDRYFYVTSFDNIKYLDATPVTPYYEVIFKCNSSSSKRMGKKTPVLSYMDQSFRWTPRYLLNVPAFGAVNQSSMFAYADIHNTGKESLVIKTAELVSGDIQLTNKATKYSRSDRSAPITFAAAEKSEEVTFASVTSMGEQASGTHVYQLDESSDLVISPYSVKSIPFLQAKTNVEPFVFYSSSFSAMNIRDKLRQAYNISFDVYLPEGRLILREQDRFVAETNIPMLSKGEVFTMKLGHDADVSYRRLVKIIQGSEKNDSITYQIRYIFRNHKTSRDIRLDFTESFSSYRYFNIANISKSNINDRMPSDLQLVGSDLRGYFLLPKGGSEKIVDYDVTMFKSPRNLPTWDNSQ